MHQIYLDYNASTPVDPEVAEAMIPYLSELYANPSSSHNSGIHAKRAIENARKNVASMIGASPDEIIFTSGGTESNNFAIKGIAYANRHKGNHIITSVVEHPSVTEVCRYLEKNGFVITWLPVDEEGVVFLPELAKSITPSTILISVMHANNETGTIQPVAEIGKIARQHGIPFHTDAAQSCGKIPVNVEEIKADLLTIAGHKFYAPKGVGALYIRRGTALEKLIHGADHEQNLRAGTENVASVVGLGKAAELSASFIRDMNGDGTGGDKKTMKQLRDIFHQKLLDEIPEMKLNGPVEKRLPNTLNVSFPGVEANLMLEKMTGIAASAGAACHAGSVSASQVLKAMHVPEKYAMGTIRFSLGRMTTAAELEKAVPHIVNAYRQLSKKITEESLLNIPDAFIGLTHYTHSLGCACKIKPDILEELLKDLPVSSKENILVGTETRDDAAVYMIDDKTAIVQTVDFIPPIVDDPYEYGAIAAANALSDIYAMGGIPLFALSIVAFPVNQLPLETLQRIMKGASDKATEAGISILGGHTIEDTEPKFGLVVTGRIDPEKILRNSTAKPGDVIILTKPVGTGILSTGIKREMTEEKSKERMITAMMQLNKTAAEVMNRMPVSACTDVTGFGLLGHLKEMVLGSGIGAVIGAENVPLFPGALELAVAGIIPGGTDSNLKSVEETVEWEQGIPQVTKLLLADAQTSGGLLISIPREKAGKILKELHLAGIRDAAPIGYFAEGQPKITIKKKLLFRQ